MDKELQYHEIEHKLSDEVKKAIKDSRRAHYLDVVVSYWLGAIMATVLVSVAYMAFLSSIGA